MNRILTAALAIATLAGVSSAHATQNTDLFCSVTDTQGSKIIYTFANNSDNADGSVGGTMVETGFSKNGHDVFAPVGGRPIWIVSLNRLGGLTIASRNDAGWALVEGAVGNNRGVYAGPVALYHNNRIVASGGCARRGMETAGNVSDRGL